MSHCTPYFLVVDVEVKPRQSQDEDMLKELGIRKENVAVCDLYSGYLVNAAACKKQIDSKSRDFATTQEFRLD